jgi:hypothetical protein
MKKFKVSLVRIEHTVYQLEVEADSAEQANEIAITTWNENEEAFVEFGLVHMEDFINDIEEVLP